VRVRSESRAAARVRAKKEELSTSESGMSLFFFTDHEWS